MGDPFKSHLYNPLKHIIKYTFPGERNGKIDNIIEKIDDIRLLQILHIYNSYIGICHVLMFGIINSDSESEVFVASPHKASTEYLK